MRVLSDKSKSDWIDFKELRAKLKFADVLAHYNVQAKIKGDRAYALCPLPTHSVHQDGKKRTASLSINLDRGVFQCFGCKIGGNVVEFAALMEGFDPNDPDQFRQAAVKIANIFNITTGGKNVPSKSMKPNSDSDVKRDAGSIGALVVEAEPTRPTLPVIINTPLEFELKSIDLTHPYLKTRGLTDETIKLFRLGFCAKGMMKDRIAIPLHNRAGQLVGYAGRLVDDEKISDDSPKYLFPGSREREGKRYEFHKSELLYNAHRLARCNELTVVEGFMSVFWLHQNGYSNAVATMGSSVTHSQVQQILDLTDESGRIWIMADNDEAGELLAKQLLVELSSQRWCKWVRGEPDRQPTDYSANELNALFRHE